MQILSRWCGFLIISLLFLSPSASAFQIQPVGTEYDQKLAQLDESKAERLLAKIADRGAAIFLEPVHEEITQRIYGCNDSWGDKVSCAKKQFAPKAVIDGARWNDNPPFMVKEKFILPNGKEIKSTCANETIKLSRKSDCWVEVFKASSAMVPRRYFTNRNGIMLNRSHFGDLQFLHSMASRVGDRAQDTKSAIMMWAEFAYKVAAGKIQGSTMLKDVHLGDFDKLFAGQEATVENLFLMGDTTYRGSSLKNFAFGTLLHMVQDSFTESHVSRDLSTQGAPCNCKFADTSPAKIEKFLVYSAQDSSKHKTADVYAALKRDAVKYTPNVIDVGIVLKRLYDEDNGEWEVVKQYLDECVYVLKDSDAEADAGNFEAD
jgi:hypothetical protein